MDFTLWLAFSAASVALLLIADWLRATIRRPGIVRGLTRVGGAALVSMGIATAGLRRATS